MRTVTIVDYGMGNIRSVTNAIEFLGHGAEVSSDPLVIRASRKLILPGVGAFGEGMKRLGALGLREALLESADSGAHMLGICLGMQMFMQRSHEFGIHEGLSLVEGEVRRMEAEDFGLRLPHIGWNAATFKVDHPVFAGIETNSCFYFVNSYACHCTNGGEVIADFEYGRRYAGVLARNNIVGVQFHPEKSQRSGLALLRNFVEW